MTIGVLVTVSCVLTSITMLIFSAALFVLIQSGSSAAQALVSRLFGFGGNRDNDDKPKETATPARARSEVSSGDVLRQRAQQLDFVPQAAVPAFTAQGAPQQATFSSRDPLAMPQQNLQFGQQQAQFGQVNPSMPSLSSARPFQAGQQPLGGQTQYGQPTQYGQQPLGGQTPQYGQPPLGSTSQQFRPQQPLGGQTPQYGQPPLGSTSQQFRPQQPLGGQTPQYGQPPIGGQRPLGNPPQTLGQQPLGGQPQQPLGGQRPLGNPPQQYNQQPLGGQPTYNPQGQYGQPPQPPAQNPLGNYAPPPRGRAGANIDDQNTSSGLRSRRDNRRTDNNEIYDDGAGGLGGIVDDLGNLFS
jgi:hypothetical protein